MTHREKRAWIMLALAIGTYAAYVLTIVGRADGRPLAEVPYAATLLWMIGAATVASTLAETMLAIANPRASRDKDVRDREVGRLGDHVGHAFVVIGAVTAMLMAMTRWEPFWIANVIYLGFVLSAIVGSVTKLVVYRRGVPQW